MKMMIKLALATSLMALAGTTALPACAQTQAQASTPQRSAHEQAARELYRNIIGFRTARGHKQVPAMVAYLKGEFVKAGFAETDISVTDYDSAGEPTQGLIVRYAAKGKPKAGPVVLLGHMDVVEALPEDWERPPFTLTEEDGYFFGRGTLDNKYGIASLSHNFIRLKQEGWAPSRDLYLVFSGDEETGMITTRAQAKLVAETIKPALVLNGDAGGVRLTEDYKPILFGVQAAEKTFATFELTVTNPGGHSSRPRKDNAIYELASALKAIEAYRFEVRDNAITRGSFAEMGKITPGPLGEAMLAFSRNPADEAARATLLASPTTANLLSTTCVATMLKGGHAENALPQSATATVNCRIFPGEGGAAAAEATLKKVIANDKVVFKLATDVVEAPASVLTPEVLAAVKAGVHPRFPGLVIAPYMESGGTDGMHYRALGMNTVAISGAAMRDADMFAHGLNERIRVEDFYAGLDHWYLILKHLAR
ncbi:MAG: M20/M25/M40 family metallo-hydrolase [Blastomonas fulva]|uniref:M20/M25/M40 family metallo-hydrolase n=1 Tax=Blastomonas fulva TaxID=1550728 RepID=UPI0024E20ECD|nr:M20/M25/M40 family metallo-hydrolase [Blastomonas fulva]MDK2756915.1 M20/M25/M40 family metallo-hydrolase [Blastomonas fulva]